MDAEILMPCDEETRKSFIGTSITIKFVNATSNACQSSLT